MRADRFLFLLLDLSFGVLSLIKLLEITELQEFYKVFASDIANYVNELEVGLKNNCLASLNCKNNYGRISMNLAV